MNRCDRASSPDTAFLPRQTGRRAALRRLTGAGAAALAALGVLAAAPARAGRRVFPMGTRRGQIDFTAPPLVQLDGKPERLGPGTRIHEPLYNRLVFANTLTGQSLAVHYVRDGSGIIREIWILSPDELREKPLPSQDPTPALPPRANVQPTPLPMPLPN